MKKTINAAEQTVTFTFEGGLEPIVFRADSASDATREYAMLHGFCQRIGDAAAISKSADNGYTVTEAMRRAEIETMAGHYASGTADWNLSGGTRKAPQNPTILKIAAKLGITYTEAEAEVQRRMLEELSE